MKKKKKKDNHKIKFNLVLVITFFTVIVFVFSTYAWVSSSVDVTISNFRLYADSKNGLYISLDGETWSDEIDVSKDIFLKLLKETYKDHETQWSDALSTVSTVGILNNNQNKFAIFYNPTDFYSKISYNNKDAFDFYLYDESGVNDEAPFLAFDIFLKNITPSPYSDNIYLDKNFEIIRDENNSHDDMAYLNAIRVGFVFYDEIDINSSVDRIQHSSCNNNCTSTIFDPYPYSHDDETIKDMKRHGFTISDGVHYDTYSLISAGKRIKIWDGVFEAKNTDYFKLQNTIIDKEKSITSMKQGIIKVRVYIWLEGQDIDIIEKQSMGDLLNVKLNFVKDYASYQ